MSKTISSTFTVNTMDETFSVTLSAAYGTIRTDSETSIVASTNIHVKITAFLGNDDVTSQCTMRVNKDSWNGDIDVYLANSGTATAGIIVSANTNYSLSSSQWLLFKAYAGDSLSANSVLNITVSNSSFGTKTVSFVLAPNIAGKDGRSTKRLYKSTNSSTYQVSRENPEPPTGWSETPTAITTSNRYRWVSESVSTDGGVTWGSWSTPQIDAYLSADGTSINITGSVIAVVADEANLPSTASEGNLGICTNPNGSWGQTYGIDILACWVSGAWEDSGPRAANGDYYINSTDGHLWQYKNNAWLDLGQIRGEKGDDGNDAIMLTLRNVHEDFIYDSTDTRVSAIVTSQAVLMKGGSALSAGITWYVSCNDGSTWVNQGNTYTSGNAKAKISSAGLLTVEEIYVQTATVKVRAKYNNVYYYADFTANRTSQDKYEIVLNPNSVTYNADTFSNKNIAISAIRTDLLGNKATIGFGSYSSKSYISSTYGQGYIRLFATRTISPASGVYNVVTDQIVSTPYTINSTSASRDDAVLFELRLYESASAASSSSYTVLDYQSIPIPKSANGRKGTMGRFYYYAGDWNTASASDTFDVSAAQAPYFSYTASGNTTGYYVFNPEETGTYSKSAIISAYGNPSNNAPWEQMENDIKYLITEAVFAPNAKFGSAVISGDWMISTNGTINGVDYDNGATYTPTSGSSAPAYTFFDPSNPNKSVSGSHDNGKQWTGYNFVPNYSVDLLTGKTYQNEAYINGVVSARLFYASVKTITETSYSINLASEPYYTYYAACPNNTRKTITLPNPSTFDGVELRFFSPILGSNYTTAKITYSGGIYVVYSGLFTSATNIYLKANKFATIKAMNGSWWCVDENVDKG